MANKKVTVVRYCKVECGGEKSVWKRYPAAQGKNGRIRPGWVVVNGQPVHCPVGHYELRHYEGRRLRYTNAGDDAQEATNAKERMEWLLAAHVAADNAGVKVVEDDDRKLLRKSAALYIQDRKNQGKMEAAVQAQNVTDEFVAYTGKTYLDELTKEDIYAFHARCRKHGLSDRTVANKHDRLKAFLRFAGVDVKTVMPPRPKYEKKLPTIYTAEKVATLLSVLEGSMRIAIGFGMMCGLRAEEIAHLEWPDVEWSDKMLRVRGKPHWQFIIKDSEQREIPIPDALLNDLQLWRQEHGNARLILGTKSARPNTHILRQFKRFINRVGLNCKVCPGCNSKNKECGEWNLHTLRRTYATTVLRERHDVATVQRLLGHSDLASTMRYLRPAGNKEIHASINAIFAVKPKVSDTRTPEKETIFLFQPSDPVTH
jgi:integrase